MHEPGIQEVLRRNLERLHFGDDLGELFAGTRGWPSSASTRRPRRRATPT